MHPATQAAFFDELEKIATSEAMRARAYGGRSAQALEEAHQLLKAQQGQNITNFHPGNIHKALPYLQEGEKPIPVGSKGTAAQRLHRFEGRQGFVGARQSAESVAEGARRHGWDINMGGGRFEAARRGVLPRANVAAKNLAQKVSTGIGGALRSAGRFLV